MRMLFLALLTCSCGLSFPTSDGGVRLDAGAGGGGGEGGGSISRGPPYTYHCSTTLHCPNIAPHAGSDGFYCSASANTANSTAKGELCKSPNCLCDVSCSKFDDGC